ncbi:alpha-L-fucosidase [Dyadobacter jejuensis]|uniref:alpha-L-fucosidase n=1 Tax=Dyadobacter jejuensis TaxID=1082580 RepID=A0A316ABA5_9BACT|nr:alpha-L-fucosidase [Dyadobacter jejuensis]PWJ55005.1 alpha-L-fucosidase [Dyadobacter jejuensis]
MMYYKFKFLLLSLLVTAGSVALGQEKKHYTEDWESIRSQYEIPAWFRDAKFGIFLHWGVYAVPETSSEKYPLGMYDSNWRKYEGENNPYNYQRRVYGEPSKFGYKDFVPQFKAEKFDANEWVTLFKDAGARYVVPVAEHHDGYAMYDSKFTRWNVVNTGPKKDIMRDLANACKVQGVKFGVSSHFAFNQFYYKKTDPSWDTADPQYADLYGLPYEKEGEPTPEFLKLWWNRTTDIIDQYQPDLIWFDYGLDRAGFVPMHKKILAYYYNKGLEWNKEVVFQDKNMKYPSFPEDLIVLDLERGRMDAIFKYPWQTDTSIGKRSWGYIKDEDYKTSDYLLDELVDIVSKNGCLLLNVGPKADGTIAEEARQILTEMGAWLEVNGEVVYDTRPWKIFGEGPTKVSQGNHSEKNNKDAGAEDIRFTTKNGVLYATALGWPEDGSFIIKSLAQGNPNESRKIAKVEFISGKNKIHWKQTALGLEIDTKGQKPGPAAYAFRITFKD